MTHMSNPALTRDVYLAIDLVRRSAYGLIDALDDIEREGEAAAWIRDRLSARTGKLGEDAWRLERLMEELLDSDN